VLVFVDHLIEVHLDTEFDASRVSMEKYSVNDIETRL